MQRYIENRKKITEGLDDNSMLVIFSGEEKKSSQDATYRFIANKNFYYLTGIRRPEFKLVITKKQGKLIEKLFIEKPDYDIEKWVGIKMTKDEAREISGIESIEYLEGFDSYITSQSYQFLDAIYTDFSRLNYDAPSEVQDRFILDYQKKFPFVVIKNALPLLTEARMIKSKYEIEEMRRAIDMTKRGLEKIMKTLKPGAMEYQLDSVFKHSITFEGSEGHSFETIAASGKNAVILHYIENREALNDGDLVLMDLGALSNGYPSDISRTYPINGKYTDRQKQLYNIVLGAMDAVMAEIKPGTPFAKLNEVCTKYLAGELVRIGLIEDEKDVTKYYYHGVSHHLGLDVHDLSDRTTTLKAGNVITVEPGLYIAEEGIGIRIEDDVLVTEDGFENLSACIIKKPEDVEAFIAG